MWISKSSSFTSPALPNATRSNRGSPTCGVRERRGRLVGRSLSPNVQMRKTVMSEDELCERLRFGKRQLRQHLHTPKPGPFIKSKIQLKTDACGKTTRTIHYFMEYQPTTDFDLEPFVPLGSFGHIPSILQRMERQLEAANRHLDNFPMLTEHGEWGSIVPSYARTDGPLDFLKDAYEVGEDGKLHFKVKFNVKGFGPKDIKVSTSKNRLTVHGKKSSKTNSSSSSSEFCRTIYLPESVDDDRFQCHLTSDGILMLEAPVKTPDYESLTFNHEPQLAVKPITDKSSALQVTGVTGPTVLKDSATGQKLHVEVPIEPGFTADDLNVRIDANRVVVSGRKHVVEGSGSSHCSHTKEFHRAYTIPETVDPLSVVTQLQGETLVVEAPMVKST